MIRVTGNKTFDRYQCAGAARTHTSWRESSAVMCDVQDASLDASLFADSG